MASLFILTKEQLREYRSRAGKKWSQKQKMDKACGWKQRTEVRTRLSSERPVKPSKPDPA